MEKVIRLNESTLVKIIKKIITENDFGIDDKKLKLMKIALKYLTKRFKGNTISEKEYVDALVRMNFKEFSRSKLLFNFYNQHVKEGDWDNVDYSKLINHNGVEEGLRNFLEEKIPVKDVLDIYGSGNPGYIDQGFNNFPMEVDIRYKFMGEEYIVSFEVDGSFYYTFDHGDYNTPPSDSVDSEDITINSSQVMVYDEEGDEYPIDLDKNSIKKLEIILLYYFDPLEGKIKYDPSSNYYG